jgi:hypothetical protein
LSSSGGRTLVPFLPPHLNLLFNSFPLPVSIYLPISISLLSQSSFHPYLPLKFQSPSQVSFSISIPSPSASPSPSQSSSQCTVNLPPQIQSPSHLILLPRLNLPPYLNLPSLSQSHSHLIFPPRLNLPLIYLPISIFLPISQSPLPAQFPPSTSPCSILSISPSQFRPHPFSPSDCNLAGQSL